jgi:hypothetical protein
MRRDQLHGIEIVNCKRWYPNGLKWFIYKNLSIIANSDVHGLTHWLYEFSSGDHRPMTLIFAEELTENAIKNALFEGRTLAFFKRGVYNLLLGKEQYLEAILKASIDIKISDQKEGFMRFRMINNSGLDFHLVKENHDPRLNFRRNYFLHAHSEEEITVIFKEKMDQEKISLGFRIENLLSYPDTPLKTEFVIMRDVMITGKTTKP